MSELKPCPFCGGSDFSIEMKEHRHLNSVGDWYYLRCESAGCSAKADYPSRDGLITKWNTRAVPDVPELVTVGHLWEYAEYYRDDRGYYGYVKIITEENPSTHVSPASKIRHHRELVARDQAAEIIRSMIPRVNNCGRYIAERNDGTLMYLNHGNTWQGCDNFISAKDKEIERLKLRHTDEMNDFILMGMARDEFKNRAEAAEAKLAQYEAQKPVGYVSEYGLNKLASRAFHQMVDVRKSIEGDHTIPLYAQPAPAADLKAENEKLREALQDIENLYQPRTPIQRAINIARAALNLEASNDKG